MKIFGLKTGIALLFPILFALLASPAYAEETKSAVQYTGIMNFFNWAKEAIIVAPTLNERTIDSARISCERKKNFIENNFQTKIRIVSDRDLTDADKKGNLIIVGRNNKVLKEIWQKTPIRPTPDSFFFNGEEYAHPRDHIVFAQLNPFNISSMVLISTSIDADVDRIRPFPLIGSDWVIMRDLSVIRQGRFYGETSLPPTSDSLAEFNDTEEIVGFYSNLKKFSSQYYEVFYPADIEIKDRIADGAKKRDTALLQIAQKMGLKTPESKFKIFLYNDKEQKKKISGVADPVHWMDARREVHMLGQHFLANPNHEDAHVVGGFMLSEDPSIQMIEGFAVSYDAAWKNKPLAYWSGFFLRIEKIPSLSDLFDEGKFIKYPQDNSFPLIGSITSFLIERYGFESFRKLAGQIRVNDALLKETIGQGIGQLESAWKADIKAKAVPYAKEIDFAFFTNAAKKQIEKKDFAGAIKELNKALEIVPDDAQTLFNLASACMRVPDLKIAEKTLLKILNLKLSDADQYFITFSHYQLGRVYDLMGKRQKAIEEYKKVLALPDKFDSHKLAQDRIDRPATQYDFE